MAAVHQPDACNDSGAGRIVVVHAVRGQRGDLEEGAAVVEKPVDPLPGKQLAACHVPFARLFRPAQGGGGEAFPQLVGERALRKAVGLKRAAGSVQPAGECLH